jgi:hypothetical protein
MSKGLQRLASGAAKATKSYFVEYVLGIHQWTLIRTQKLGSSKHNNNSSKEDNPALKSDLEKTINKLDNQSKHNNIKHEKIKETRFLRGNPEGKNYGSDRCKFHHIDIVLQYKKIIKLLRFLSLTYTLSLLV